MIDHLGLDVGVFRRSRDFYAAALAPLGYGLKVALAAGGRDNGAPGLRPRYPANYYAAFVFDPGGHNIEAVCPAPGSPADQTEQY